MYKRVWFLIGTVLLLSGCVTSADTPTPIPPTATPILQISPSARGYHRMAYDVESDRAILYGGFSPNDEDLLLLDDTWAYDPNENTWRKMDPTLPHPAGSGFSMAYDIQSDRVILFMGNLHEFQPTSETWAYDYNTDSWVNMEPTKAPFGFFGARMAYDAESDRMILFGGMDVEAAGAGEFKFFDDTWAYDFDSNNWTRMKPADTPPGRNYYPMAYDASSDRIVLFGADPGETNDMWSYDYNADTWEELEPGETPSLRLYCDMVYDAQSDRMILFGGTELPWYGEEPFGDTWAYHLDTETWTEQNTAISPSQRGWYAAVYSTKSKLVILFGGGTTRSTFRNETWIYDPSANVWTNVTPNPQDSANED